MSRLTKVLHKKESYSKFYIFHNALFKLGDVLTAKRYVDILKRVYKAEYTLGDSNHE